jgi:hypothetical protein
MDARGLFANLAAVAIEQSYTHHNLAALIDELMISARGTPRRQGLRQDAQAFAVRI